MATRRAKLRNVFAEAVSQGVSTADLLESISTFTAGGGSGIERFLDEWLTGHTWGAEPDAGVLPVDKIDAAKYHLNLALVELSG